MRIEVTLTADNAAFEDDAEVPRILRWLADRITGAHPKVGDGCSLFDANGNRVGCYEVRNV